jgi:diguanylate cyclase (GGDEF)-like protein
MQLPYLAGRRTRGADFLAGRAPLIRPEPDAAAILGSIGEALYQWDIATDRLDWGAGHAAVLGPFADLDLSTGMAFGALIAAENATSRYDVIHHSTAQDTGDGVSYQLVYTLTPPPVLGSAPQLWLEDTGCWFADPAGRPARAQGALRVLAGPDQFGRRQALASSLDPLTGLPDRARLLALTQAFLDRAHPAGFHTDSHVERRTDGRTKIYADGRFAVLLATIENLFALNQSCGYDAGDAAIAAVARQLRANVRAGDVVARYGGNKFALLLEDCGDAEAAIVAARLVALIAAGSFETSLGVLAARIRIGVVIAPQEGRAPQTLLLHA